MKFRHHGFSIAAAALAFGTGTASAQGFDVQCVKGDDERSIKVVLPGNVGTACDVEYRRSDSGLSTPFHADNSPDFCGEKATEIVSTLISSGYTCGQTAGVLTAEARAPEPVEPSPEPVAQPTSGIVEPTQMAATISSESARVESSPPVETTAMMVQQDAPLPDSAAPDADVSEVTSAVADESETVATADDLNAAVRKIEDNGVTAENAPIAPSRDVATTGPATLGAELLPELTTRTAPLPAGRLVGAAPTETIPSQVSTQADPVPAIQPTQAAIKMSAKISAPAMEMMPETQPSSVKATDGRKAEEVIVATLNAQTAAWNEGNLPAFMDSYWNDGDLKFVSGTEITKGWSSTMKRYRDSYGSEAGFGQLALEKIDVQEMTDDVAVVTGRFNLVNGDLSSGGVFTLVMQRMNGVWRIVHDHTAADPS